MTDLIRIIHGDCLEPSDLSAGLAAEHLVCADLLLAGLRAFIADQNCPYDVAVESNARLIRIQVKATRAPRAIPHRDRHIPAYMWHVRRAGKAGRRVYAATDFHLLALVALDCRKIAYMPQSRIRQTIHIRSHEDASPRGPNGGGRRGKTFEMYRLETALAEVCA